ncbi:MAG: class I SAM-dependent methyltransferase [Bacteroidota bacterium]
MDKSFDFKPIDEEGAETLDVIRAAPRLNRWMYDTIRPFCKGNILEIGSGIGNISAFFIQNEQFIHLSDIRDVYCERLKSEFGTCPNVLGIDTIDIVASDFETRYAHLLGSFDTIFHLNVLEHIENDKLALQNCYKLLKKDGNLIVLTPAFQTLYNGFDEALDHYRRYSKPGLKQLLLQADFHILHSQYYNLAGILGWYISGKLEKNKTIPMGEMKFYNMLVPIFRLIDRIVFNALGLSVVVVGRK